MFSGYIQLYYLHDESHLATQGAQAAQKIGDRTAQERILGATLQLSSFPACANVKPLVNHEYGYRLRVGRWRILFHVFEEISIVSIEGVKKRNDHTY